MKFRENEEENKLESAEKEEVRALKKSIEIQIYLAKLALESAERDLSSLFDLCDEDDC